MDGFRNGIAHCIQSYSAVHEKDNDMREYDLEQEEMAEAEAGELLIQISWMKKGTNMEHAY